MAHLTRVRKNLLFCRIAQCLFGLRPNHFQIFWVSKRGGTRVVRQNAFEGTMDEVTPILSLFTCITLNHAN